MLLQSIEIILSTHMHACYDCMALETRIVLMRGHHSQASDMFNQTHDAII